MDVISKADLARILKVTPARVSVLVKAGLPVRKDGKIDRDKALAWHKERHKRPGRKPGPKTEEQTLTEKDLLEARTRKERALAELRELEAAKMRGALLDRSEVKSAWAAMIIRAKEKFLGIGAELSDSLAIEVDPVRCQEVIDGRVTAALREMGE